MMAQPCRVLVVDDCPDTTGTMALLLRLWGYEAAVAADGPTALVAAERFLPHVVLLDLAMPAMDGFELTRRLRGRAELASALLVAVSGFGRDEDRQRALEAGCDCHLLKPLDPDELQRLLEFYAGRRYEDQAAARDGLRPPPPPAAAS
jgi:two-component system CheB/CheR fusion protein